VVVFVLEIDLDEFSSSNIFVIGYKMSVNLHKLCSKTLNLLIILLSVLTLTSNLLASHPLFIFPPEDLHFSGNDYSVLTANISKHNTEAYSFTKPFLLGAIKSYQLFISPSKGTYCPMYPSCSAYGFEAFESYNPIKALIVTSDRLHRCSHDLDNYETTVINDYIRFVDPVEMSLALNLSDIKLSRFASLRISDINKAISIQDSDTALKIIYGDDKQIYDFANRLRADGDMQRAITEYKRLISYYPKSSYFDLANISLLNSYFSIGEFLNTIHTGQEILNMNHLMLDVSEVNYVIGSSYFKLNNFNLARQYFINDVDISGVLQSDKSILLVGLTYANEDNWDKAIHTFSKINEESQYFRKADRFRLLSIEGSKFDEKSRFAAGTLAIVPGLGYLYSGYNQTAISAFLVNSLFFWATNEAFQRDNTSMGVMLGVLSFGWYTGNIYGSIISATRSNLKVKNDLLLNFDMNF